jgi:hypothetical protein
MSISALAKCCPTWAEFRPIHAFEAQVDVVATRRSSVLTSVFELRVLQLSEEIWVFERPVGEMLPACCPERHINPGGSFCIGLNAGKGITLTPAFANGSMMRCATSISQARFRHAPVQSDRDVRRERQNSLRG